MASDYFMMTGNRSRIVWGSYRNTTFA